MRVLVTLLPSKGALNSLLPLAVALKRAGHSVAFCSAASFRHEVERHGFQYFEAGMNWQVSDPRFMQKMIDAAGGRDITTLFGREHLAWLEWAGDYLCMRSGLSMVPDVLAIAQSWAADTVVRDPMEFGGCAAAELLGIAHASAATTPDSVLDLRDRLARPLAQLRSEVGLPPDPDMEMPYRYLHLCFTPRSYEGAEAKFPPTAHFIRHGLVQRPGESLPFWVDELPDQPTVLVSMGTVFNRIIPGLFEEIIDALRNEAVNLIVAVGSEHAGWFGDQPPNVYIEPWISFSLVLPLCDLFVTHGGGLSVRDALTFGIPMVVVPIFGDQLYSADRCAALGIARVVGSDERRPEIIQEAAREVLTDPGYRKRVQQISRDMAALPEMHHAVQLLEKVAVERQPLFGPS